MNATTVTESFQVPAKVANSNAGSVENAGIDSEASGGRVEEKRRRKLADVPSKYRRLYRMAWERKSRKKAIRGFCLECVCYMPSEVRLCTSPDCPLYEFRLKG